MFEYSVKKKLHRQNQSARVAHPESHITPAMQRVSAAFSIKTSEQLDTINRAAGSGASPKKARLSEHETLRAAAEEKALLQVVPPANSIPSRPFIAE